MPRKPHQRYKTDGRRIFIEPVHTKKPRGGESITMSYPFLDVLYPVPIDGYDNSAAAAVELLNWGEVAPDLYDALDKCPLPSTMGTVETHYQRFYDWYREHVEPALSKARGETT